MGLIPEVESSRMSLASKVKSLTLASKPQVLENCPVLGSRIALFFWVVKSLCSTWKIFWKTFFSGDRLKNFSEDLFFFESTCTCVPGPWPWPQAFLSWPREGLSLVGPSLGLGFFLCAWPRALCSRLHLCLLLYLKGSPKGWYPQTMSKYLSVKCLLISKNTDTLG